MSPTSVSVRRPMEFAAVQLIPTFSAFATLGCPSPALLHTPAGRRISVSCNSSSPPTLFQDGQQGRSEAHSMFSMRLVYTIG